MGILYVTHLGPLGVLRELLQKKWVVQIVLSPPQPPCDPDQPYGEEPGQEGDRPSPGAMAGCADDGLQQTLASHSPAHPGEQVGPQNDSEAGALVAQPPQVCKAFGPAIYLPAGSLGQSPGPRPTAPTTAAAAGTAAAATAGAATAAPVLIDGDLDLGQR